MIDLILQQHIPDRMTAVSLVYNCTNLSEQLQPVLFATAQIYDQSYSTYLLEQLRLVLFTTAQICWNNCSQSYLQQHKSVISLNYNSTNLRSYLQQHRSLISLVYNSTNL